LQEPTNVELTITGSVDAVVVLSFPPAGPER
jgi:hypothetical protein